MGDVWGDARFCAPLAGEFEDVFTGATRRVDGELRLAELLADFPVALLIRRPA